MNNELNFKSSEELYNRISPALYSKVQELKRLKIDYIKEEDIWNYLIKNEWKKRENLTIAQMVNDILNIDNDLIIGHVLEIFKNENRKVNLDESDLL
jgi:hypothetical protein